MERITMSLDTELARDFDALIAQRGYVSRSEAMRDLLRREIEAGRSEHDGRGYCVANLTYVYNHHVRDLALRLTEAQHAQHDLVVATTHMHLDHEHCLESMMLKGPIAAVRAFADSIRAQRGVTHGQLNVISVATTDGHAAGGKHRHRGHMHLIPRS